MHLNYAEVFQQVEICVCLYLNVSVEAMSTLLKKAIDELEKAKVSPVPTAAPTKPSSWTDVTAQGPIKAATQPRRHHFVPLDKIEQGHALRLLRREHPTRKARKVPTEDAPFVCFVGNRARPIREVKALSEKSGIPRSWYRNIRFYGEKKIEVLLHRSTCKKVTERILECAEAVIHTSASAGVCEVRNPRTQVSAVELTARSIAAEVRRVKHAHIAKAYLDRAKVLQVHQRVQDLSNAPAAVPKVVGQPEGEPRKFFPVKELTREEAQRMLNERNHASVPGTPR
jgi:hypothetical protein